MGAGAVNQIYILLVVAGACVLIVGSFEAAGVVGHSHGQCNHDHHDHNHKHHDHDHQDDHYWTLPEELAEEEDLKLYGFESHNHHPHVHVAEDLTGLRLWVSAMGCSLLVSLASLICLIILPLLFLKGKPSKAVVDSLALFGAGAMLGDAFLHQLPHAFGGGHSHSHDHHVEHSHHHDHSEHAHAHSLEDLSVGLSVLAGIVLFLIVEKLVRYVEAFSGGVDAWGHGHHHHHHNQSTKLKDDNENLQELPKEKSGSQPAVGTENGKSADSSNGAEKQNKQSVLRKRSSGGSTDPKDKTNSDFAITSVTKTGSVEKETAAPQSSLVFGYLNLFSDGVHNFTDGIALGSAFLLYGSVGGWSRTLFLLAHELPQEIGDFGILVRSGFSVSKALFFNFLSALVALAGTALALTLGKDPGQSSLIEGFTAGGFIYISVAGVLAEMNSGSSPSLKNTVIQLISLLSGMAVALCISLAE